MTGPTDTHSRNSHAGAADPGAKKAKAGAAGRGTLVQSLQRGIAVLDIVAHHPHALTCKEIAAEVGIDRTITHRILRTLEVEGLVRMEAGRYMLANRCALIGNAYTDQINLRRAALPFLLNLLHRGLAKWDVSSLSLFVQVGPYVTIIEQLWPPDASLDVIMTVGSRMPIDRTASGRSFLAYATQKEVIDLIGAERAAQLAPRFEEIVASGGIDFAGDEEAHAVAGMGAVAAPIRDRHGDIVACLAASGLNLEEQLSRTSEMALLLRRAADQIGMNLR